jgi:hypothetical protein
MNGSPGIPRLSIYTRRGKDSDDVPGDITHVVVDSSVEGISENAFILGCEALVSVLVELQV